MSAIACRVAVVPGRNAIGIELPNANARDRLSARDDLASRDFETTKHKLRAGLGQDHRRRAGDRRLAKMPHCWSPAPPARASRWRSTP
jgi:S-DNA-T family DNA segregation ATPase FtsK/SpoIIIE